MSTVITCGFSTDDCGQAQRVLEALGLSSPRTCSSSEYSPVDFSRRFQSVYGVTRSKKGKDKAANLGEAWRQAASEIILNNADRAPWGWAEPSNLYTLEFWKEFEPTCSFLIIYSTPTEALARQLLETNKLDGAETTTALESWRAYYRAALDFAQRNPESTILIHKDALSDPQNFQDLAAERLGLKTLDDNSIAAAADLNRTELPALVRLISATLASQDHDTLTCYQELEASADLASGQVFKGVDPSLADAAWAQLGDLESAKVKLVATEAELKVSNEKQTRLGQDADAIRDELQSTVTQLNQSKEAVTDLKQRIEARDLSLDANARDIARATSELEQLRQRLATAEDLSKDQQTQIATDGAALSESRSEVERLEQELVESGKALEAKNEEAEEFFAKLQSLQETVELNKAELEDRSAETAGLRADREADAVKIENLTRDLQANQEELATRTEDQARLETENSQTRDLLAKSDASNSDLKQTLQAHEATIAAFRDDIAQLTSSLAASEDGRAAVEADASSLRANLQAEQEAVESKQDELDQAMLDIAQLQQDQARLKQESDELEEQLQAGKKALSGKITDLEQLQLELEKTQEDRAEALSDLEDGAQQLATIRTELAEQISRFEALNLEHTRTSAALESERSEHEALQEKFDLNEKEAGERQHELEQVMLERRKVDTELAETQQALDETVQNLGSAENTVAEVKRSLDDANRINAERQQIIEDLQAQISRQGQEIRALRKELETANTESQVKTVQLEHAQEDLERNLLRLSEQQAGFDNLTALLRETNADHSAKFTDLKAALQNSQDMVARLETERGEQTAQQADYARRFDDLMANFKALETRLENPPVPPAAPEPEEDGTALDAALDDNALLRLQLEQTQEELERYFRKYQDASEHLSATQNKADSTTLSGVSSLKSVAVKPAAQPQRSKTDSQPSKHANIDLRHFIRGENWYDAEPAGRWAGPGRISTLILPRLDTGRYHFQMRIVSGMSLDIIEGLSVRVNDQPILLSRKIMADLGGRLAPLRRLKMQVQRAPHPYPIDLTGSVNLTAAVDQAKPKFFLEVPQTISPSLSGGTDDRLLSVQVQSINLTLKPD